MHTVNIFEGEVIARALLWRAWGPFWPAQDFSLTRRIVLLATSQERCCKLYSPLSSLPNQ